MKHDSGELHALVYSSFAADSVGEPQLIEILEGARAKNARLGITGILFYREGRFVQYLEGSPDRVRALYAEILSDPRHEHLRTLYEKPVQERRFSSWTMGYEALRETSLPRPEKVRDTFADLERSDEPAHVLRALDELTLWFRIRTASV